MVLQKEQIMLQVVQQTQVVEVELVVQLIHLLLDMLVLEVVV